MAVLSNDQMKAGRYLRFQQAKRKLEWIKARSAEGLDVYVCTYTKSTRFTPKTMAKGEWFKATRSGLYVARGRQWDCVDGCKIVAQ